MSLRKDMLEGLWPGATQPSTEGLGEAPGFRPEMTDTAAEKRHARTAELRQARMEKQAVMDAEARVQAEAKAAAKPKPRRSRPAQA